MTNEAESTSELVPVNQEALLERGTVAPDVFGGKTMIPGGRLAIEHVKGLLVGGDSINTMLEGYPWLQREDVLACLVCAR
jgi:uncharacterized protein (DUF433 family)